MGLLSYVAVTGGAAIGALLRWGLGVTLNPVFPSLPLGTLAANLTGGLLMGISGRVVLGARQCAARGAARHHDRVPRRLHHVLYLLG